MRIAPSILAADFARLGAEVEAVTGAGADRLHIDVMDGHFVPNLTIGPAVVAALRPCTDRPFDVHLMVTPPDMLLAAFAEAGADSLSVHPEAGPHLHRSLETIRKLGKQAGVALNPGTPISAIENVLDLLDLVCVMSVDPGFGGQPLIESQLDKVARLREMLDRAPGRVDIHIDGGVNFENAARVRAAGVDVMVAGTAAFTGGPDAYAGNIRRLRGCE